MILFAIAMAATPLQPPAQIETQRTERYWRRLCTWHVNRLADLPEFRVHGENRRDRRIRASVEQINSCNRKEPR